MFLPKNDIAGERLYRHLKNMGLDADLIPKGSPDAPGIESPKKHGEPEYSFSIRLRGLNIDVIQVKRYNIVPNYVCCGCYVGYRIDYIIRGFERDKWHLEKKLKNLGASEWDKIFKGNVRLVKPDEENRCVRIYVFSPTLREDRTVIEEVGKRVNYVSIKDVDLPSKETIEAYDKIAFDVRKIIESG